MFPLHVSEIAIVLLAATALLLALRQIRKTKIPSTARASVSRAPIAIGLFIVWTLWSGWSNLPTSLDAQKLAALKNNWAKMEQRYDVEPQHLWQFQTGFPFTYEITNADTTVLLSNSVAFSKRRLLQNFVVAIASSVSVFMVTWGLRSVSLLTLLVLQPLFAILIALHYTLPSAYGYGLRLALFLLPQFYFVASILLQFLKNHAINPSRRACPAC